jgi:hypothetical protein
MLLRAKGADFWALTKPEVNFLILIATVTGFYLGHPGNLHTFPSLRLIDTLLGTLLVASGSGTLNQFLEHRFDARMRRTQRPPVASGRIRPATAAWFGLLLSATRAVSASSTEKTKKCCLDLGAHFVMDHSKPFGPQLSAIGIAEVGYIACLVASDVHYPGTIGLGVQGKKINTSFVTPRS